MLKTMRLYLAPLLLSSLALLAGADRRAVVPDSMKSNAPLSPGMWAGDTLFVSGQAARNRDGQQPDGIEAQARQTMDNVKAVVEADGLTMNDVIFTHVYLSNGADEASVRAVHDSYFTGDKKPATAIIGVAKLPNNAPLEVSAVAVKGGSSPRVYIGSQPDGASLGKALRAAGVSEQNLVLVTIYHVKDGYDQAQRENSTLMKLSDGPAVQLIQVASLPRNASVAITAVAAAAGTERKTYRTKGLTTCAAAGDVVYCSARSARPSSIDAVIKDATGQLDNDLKALGSDLGRTVAATVFMNNMDEFAAMNSAYKDRFTAPPPSRTTLQPGAVQQGAPNARVSVVAVR